MTFSTAFQADAFQVDAFQIYIPPPEPGNTGTGGFIPYAKGERKKRGLEWERKDLDWKAELQRAYAILNGELIEVADVAEIRAAVAPHAAASDTRLPPVSAIDFAALAADIEATRVVLAAYEAALIARDNYLREIDDEEAILLLS
jgi:hypothetical protein